LFLAVALGSALGAALAVGMRDVVNRMLPRAELRGETRVVDGDSLVIGGVVVRLKGIDAPEMRQVCRRGGAEWRCGLEAAERLRALVDGANLRCTRAGEDRNGRVLAVCRAAGDVDIGARLVREGWAVSYDTNYLTEEREAREATRGIWASEFERPRSWRRLHRGGILE
jgi:endonuclease YncB( thermonuclease family)